MTPKSYSGDNPEFSKPVQTFVSPGRGAEVLSSHSLSTAKRYTSWLLARKEERGQPLPQPTTLGSSAPLLRSEQSPHKHTPLSEPEPRKGISAPPRVASTAPIPSGFTPLDHGHGHGHDFGTSYAHLGLVLCEHSSYSFRLHASRPRLRMRLRLRHQACSPRLKRTSTSD